MDHRYEIIISWSDEDDCFVVDVPELPGCMAHGDTYQEAAKNAEDAISAWINASKKRGLPIPEPKGRLAYA